MPDRGSPEAPAVLRGALAQLVEEFGRVVPTVVPFQYNPEKLTRTLTPWNPSQAEQGRGAQAPLVQPYDPEETLQLTLELDATDGVADGDPLALTSGVAARIAALRALTEPTAGPLGDLVATAQALSGGGVERQATRPTVPVALLVLGPGLILPVRVSTFSVEVTEFTPALHPHMATVQLELKVLTPDAFSCRTTAASDLAVAAYRLTRLQEKALAVAHTATAAGAFRALLPF